MNKWKLRKIIHASHIRVMSTIILLLTNETSIQSRNKKFQYTQFISNLECFASLWLIMVCWIKSEDVKKWFFSFLNSFYTNSVHEWSLTDNIKLKHEILVKCLCWKYRILILIVSEKYGNEFGDACNANILIVTLNLCEIAFDIIYTYKWRS